MTGMMGRRTLLGLALAGLFGVAGTATPAAARTGNIVETAASAGQFNTLLTAARAAGLVPTLRRGGPFTVFAPTDAAFAALPAGTVQSLLRPEN